MSVSSLTFSSDEVRDRCRAHHAAFPEVEVLCAAGAFLCRAVARWVAEEGLGLDECSAREPEPDFAPSVPAERIVRHTDRQQVVVRAVPGISAGGHAVIRPGTDDQE